MANDKSLETPTYPNPITMIPSLTPHPAIEIGIAIKNITNGMTSIKPINGTWSVMLEETTMIEAMERK